MPQWIETVGTILVALLGVVVALRLLVRVLKPVAKTVTPEWTGDDEALQALDDTLEDAEDALRRAAPRRPAPHNED